MTIDLNLKVLDKGQAILTKGRTAMVRPLGAWEPDFRTQEVVYLFCWFTPYISHAVNDGKWVRRKEYDIAERLGHDAPLYPSVWVR